MFRKDPHRSDGDLAAGVWPLMVCLCYRQPGKNLAKDENLS